MRFSPRGAMIALAALCLALSAGAGDSTAGFVGSFRWTMDDDAFGGLSAIEMSDDGSQITVIGDRSAYLTARITRKNGRIVGVEATRPALLRAPNGKRAAGDSEGLAIRGDRLYVSFEGPARVMSIDSELRAHPLPSVPAFATYPGNSGFEALAIDAKGRLLTLPERSGALLRAFPVWRFDGQRWTQPYEIPRRGGFLVVGADVGPDGRLYLLEREFTGFGFLSRVRRFDMTDDALSNETELLSSSVFQFDNLEGIAVWRDDTGEIRLTMVSDDNFNPLQKTELVEFRVPETLASRGETP
ncbi:esterase-like activity of phytase family protein [Salipiger sp. 1_MG-2023]|uniref:esterase-like activity of phytase family protein n=1 Tax=Salipiger sp. 1_MG-2023 TaxID=3062665 RepID=UPI0026E2E64C|nr:esterase-like activity of phytase family protein [Salipiger sp. 1_MG-2023]